MKMQPKWEENIMSSSIWKAQIENYRNVFNPMPSEADVTILFDLINNYSTSINTIHYTTFTRTQNRVVQRL